MADSHLTIPTLGLNAKKMMPYKQKTILKDIKPSAIDLFSG